MSYWNFAQRRDERQQSDAAAREIPAECKEKIHHEKSQALEQAAQQGWVISTLRDIQNSDGQVSRKPALTLKLILLGARGWTRWPPGGPSNLTFPVILNEFPGEKTQAHLTILERNFQHRYHSLTTNEHMQTKLCTKFSILTLKMNTESGKI